MEVHTTVTLRSNNTTEVILLRPEFTATDDSLIFLHDDNTLCCTFQLFYEVSGAEFHITRRHFRNAVKISVRYAVFSELDNVTRSTIQNNTNSSLNFINITIPITRKPLDIVMFFNLSLIGARWINEVQASSENTTGISKNIFNEQCRKNYYMPTRSAISKKPRAVRMKKYIISSVSGISVMIIILPIFILGILHKRRSSLIIRDKIKKVTNCF
ncbi:hypothetical protein RF11_08451 [Thelohanellus kitauei]|uniref:Uncharacterized protein n=1 Tax=Thelohanellus kitauei TaxID=669202 RepID=A0A0C2M7F0_THEKT|nr:hypothetical protein RF11_08451 [Thelohanellus kitauei]